MDPNNDDTLKLPMQPIGEDAVLLRIDPEMSWPEELAHETEMWAASVRRTFDEARTLYAQYAEIRGRNDQNEHLTPAGKLAANREFAEGLLPDLTKRLEAVRRQQEDLEAQTVKQLAEGIMKRPTEPNDIADMQEIRAFLKALPESERMDRLDFLVRKGDTTAIRAVLTAPAAYVMGLDENVVALLRDDVARKANPERYAKVEKLRKGLQATERALDGVVRYLTHDTSDAGFRERSGTVSPGRRNVPLRSVPTSPNSPEAKSRIGEAYETALSRQDDAA